eukprot:TRINITY_DN23745_c0_g1_i3.p1 TRINITY_DN23745_c0_g1~~TRINITY_DN23745_c0_g1_i3.p1  ORF type:complete len:421 (-),score=81.31 TRINITY_DN23745_c0_g1_i3:764-2026(-)
MLIKGRASLNLGSNAFSTPRKSSLAPWPSTPQQAPSEHGGGATRISVGGPRTPLAVEIPRMPGLDRKVRASLIEMFKIWDTNGDGYVTRSSLRRVMRFATNDDLPEEVLDMMMTAADANNDGMIQIDEFLWWVFDPRTGMLASDIDPSKMSARRFPMVINLLQEWFELLDMNRNGVIEYEEFAAAKLLVNRDKNTTEDIDEEFNWLQGASSEQKIRWNDFVNEYGRLLDGVPRPVEEKAEIIKTKVTRLQAALKLAEETLRATPLLSKMRMKEFIEVLQQAHGSSLEEAFDVLDLHDRGFVTMADLTSALERLLKVNRETHKEAEYRHLEQRLGRFWCDYTAGAFPLSGVRCQEHRPPHLGKDAGCRQTKTDQGKGCYLSEIGAPGDWQAHVGHNRIHDCGGGGQIRADTASRQRPGPEP